jgi:NDP-sugar pyrophosphorylase family protein
LPEGVSDSIRQAYIPALLDGERIEAVDYRGYFHEHSTPHRYLEGNWNALAGKAALSHPPGPLQGVDPTARVDGTVVAPVRVGPHAVVESGATVGPFAVVGSRASVAAGAHLEKVVVWSGARAAGNLHDVIITPRAVIDGAPGPRDFST